MDKFIKADLKEDPDSLSPLLPMVFTKNISEI